MKPLVGLTGRRGAGQILGAPLGFSDSPLDIYMSEYARSVLLAGGLPVHLSLDTDAGEIVERIDALVLSGGEDVDPRRYGQAPGKHSGPFSPERDELEIALFDAAMAKGIPVLGICRGSQLINVARGGTLIQHLEVGTGESHASLAYPRAHRGQEITLKSGSIVADLYGDSVHVNSFHHQAADQPGRGVTFTGTAADGIVESFEIEGHPVVGVQWHPECFGGDPIFQWLIEQSKARMNTQMEKIA